MQEIYTMIVNNGVTAIIVVIFLWQYVSSIKKDESQKNKETTEKDNLRVLIINKLDEISKKMDRIVFLLKK